MKIRQYLGASFFAVAIAPTAYSMECWKAIEWNSNIATVVAQDCDKTPAGYEWLTPGQLHGLTDTYLALTPSIFDGYDTPVIYYDGVDANNLPIFGLTVIGGHPSIPNTTDQPPVQPTTYWTNWLDRDSPYGSGEWEYTGGFLPSQICEFPIAIEARTVGSSTIYTPLDNTPDNLAYFDASKGLGCRNQDQDNGRCNDYQVRFQCQTGTWKGWLNRDSASGSGDYEHLGGFTAAQVCASPIDIRARVANTTQVISSATSAPDNLASFGPNGVVCKNADQTDNQCENYEVKFLCP